jgi:hypothetical protein
MPILPLGAFLCGFDSCARHRNAVAHHIDNIRFGPASVIPITSTTRILAWRARILLAAGRGILALMRRQDGQAAAAALPFTREHSRSRSRCSRILGAVALDGSEGRKKIVKFAFTRHVTANLL